MANALNITLALESLAHIAGYFLDLVGALLIARKYINVAFHQIPRVLFSALRKGPAAISAIAIADITPENQLKTLQGLSFIALGFLIHTLTYISGIFASLTE